MTHENGQASAILLGILWLGVVAALLLGGVAAGVTARGDRQRAADLAALAAARAMRATFDRMFESASIGGRANPRHISRAEFVGHARAVAFETARRNGVRAIDVHFGSDPAPTRIRVTVRSSVKIVGVDVGGSANSMAELLPDATSGLGPLLSGASGEYAGPFAFRQGKPMRPDVAMAFDRMARAARRDGISLIIVSAFRSDAEQAVLFAKHPDPKWVAPPGRSMHRLGTELDLGPSSAYGWLARHASRFHFIKRMSWEDWHFGFNLNAGSTLPRADGSTGGGVPGFVPAAYEAAIANAAQRWNVSANLIASQIWQESRFDPLAQSASGARGIAQFMPATARAYGLRDPFDPAQAISAQAHMMRDLLRQFGSVPLALAAYNAGPARVRACACVPPIPETTQYVAAILARMRGIGDPLATGTGLLVRLVG